ncbi:TPA: tRNA 2-thiouridine(34) synthase MnmA [Campylobacter fetus]|uniref:tRNA 2-thiouridine(34) synthase MnmA n=1 Tax=Campylobacter fetus TaxID=196 RepID=UPI00288EF8B4|nr:tRNA 2-thiouridine(34) synthase MnmA [Campylobacter fetus]HDX8147247.1 tRNA 2-thiouridine(34) synthase MnmA [Campylobacter fetus]
MKVLVALSGGVDSSMSAKYLLEAGYSVVGCYMKLHSKPGYHEENIRKVKKVGEFLGIETHILDLEEEFNAKVYEPFVNAYKEGLTPNPCAHCNKNIKFGALWKFAQTLGCDKMATGHYARIEDGLIKVASDLSKDQSYFLANISPEILPYIIFPLGDKFKVDIKAAAAQIPQIAELASQKESSEICFVETTYIDILNKHFNTLMPGVVRDVSGKVVGKHDGYMRYTIGKRKGFSVDGAHSPHYVLKIDAAKNEIVVGLKDELSSFSFTTTNFNNFTDKNELECFVKIRYRSTPIPCLVSKLDDGTTVKLKDNAGGVASGQLAVFYDEFDRVLASGFIR